MECGHRHIEIYILNVNKNAEECRTDKAREGEAVIEPLCAYLSDELCNRLDKTANPMLYRERSSAYILLSHLISKHMKTTDKCKVLFTPEGKPYLEGGGVSFSVSHASGIACVAISSGDFKLGVDIEFSCEGVRDASAVVRRFMKDAYLDPRPLGDYIMPPEDAAWDFGPTFSLRQVTPVVSSEGEAMLKLSGIRPISGLSGGALERWTLGEALLKMDGRGFSAVSELDEISSGAHLYSTALCVGENILFLSLAVEK